MGKVAGSKEKGVGGPGGLDWSVGSLVIRWVALGQALPVPASLFPSVK